MPGTGAAGEVGPGLQGCAALCHPRATEPELPGDTEEAQYQHPGEGEPDPFPQALATCRHSSRAMLGKQDITAGRAVPPHPWME